MPQHRRVASAWCNAGPDTEVPAMHCSLYCVRDRPGSFDIDSYLPSTFTYNHLRRIYFDTRREAALQATDDGGPV